MNSNLIMSSTFFIEYNLQIHIEMFGNSTIYKTYKTVHTVFEIFTEFSQFSDDRNKSK